MELLVCIKQVPDTSEIKLDPETNNLIRTGLPSIVNPDDMHALEAALAVKDQYEGSRVTVVSMGPPQAEEALRQCLALGADDAVLVTDRAFGGADTLATSYTIASAIRHIQRTMNRQFQIIFCGKQAIDGDTAQVGPQIAEELGMAQATYACELTVDQAAQNVAPELVGTEQILRVRRLQRFAQMLARIFERRDVIRKNGHEDQRQHDRQPDHGQMVSSETHQRQAQHAVFLEKHRKSPPSGTLP